MMSSKELKTKQMSEATASGIGPGDRLQAARIEAGLTIDDVANRMHLSNSILEAIEENNFDEITAPIFVKGYLRAYARIVLLDEEEMIEQYINFYSYEDPPINSTSNTSPEISSGDTRIKWMTYIVIFVLCGLLVAWWWNKDQNQGDVVSLGAGQTTPQVETGPIQKNAETIIAATTVEGSREIAKTNSTGADEVAVVEPKSVPEAKLPKISEVATEATVVPETVVIKNSAVETTASVASGSLEITVNADTWADIKDANGKKLAYDLLRAGRHLSLNGQAPFTVFFGNGHGVEMTYNREAVDLSGYTRDDNTARLKIGNN